MDEPEQSKVAGEIEAEWCGDGTAQAYISDFRRIPADLLRWTLSHPVSACVLFGLLALFIVWLPWVVILHIIGRDDADRANSYFTLLTFSALIASVTIQSQALIAQIREMRVVSDAQRASNDALVHQLQIMQVTTRIQALSSEADIYEAVERYKRFKFEADGVTPDKLDVFIVRSERLLANLGKLQDELEKAIEDVAPQPSGSETAPKMRKEEPGGGEANDHK